MQGPDTAGLEPYLQYLWEHGATDLHLAAGTQARVRIDGELIAIPESPEITSDFMLQVFASLITAEESDEISRERQLDFAFTWADTARFRANAFFQLDRPALALRLIPTEIPTPEDIGLPDVDRSAAQPAPRPGAHDRAHRIGQVHHPRGDGRLDQPQPAAAHPHHRGPDRVHPPADPGAW